MFQAKLNSRNLLKLLSLASLVAVPLFLAGCETDEDRKLAAGQACLDEARTYVHADRCLSIVEGLESEPAYLIRCSANFIAQGFTGDRVANAFNQMKDAPAGKDPTAMMLSMVVFAHNDYPNHTIAKAAENCAKSGVRSMVRLVTVAQMATLIADPSGLTNLAGTAFDPASGTFNTDQLATQITNLANNATPEQQTQIGTIAQTASDAYCNEGSAYADNDICKTLGQAMTTAGNDPQALGQQLLALLNNPNH